jgi:hypothetical protein
MARQNIFIERENCIVAASMPRNAEDDFNDAETLFPESVLRRGVRILVNHTTGEMEINNFYEPKNPSTYYEGRMRI